MIGFRAVKPIAALLLPLLPALLCSCGESRPGTPPPSTPADPSRLSSWVDDLGSSDPETRHQAAGSLRAEGEPALPLLAKASDAAGNGALSGRARFVASRIAADLTDRERKADEAFLSSESGSTALAALPRGSWALVAGGRLASSGADREEALAKASAWESVRHRFLWRVGEPVAPRVVEMGSLSPGDLGVAARKALAADKSGGPALLRAPGGGIQVLVEASGPEDWPDAAACLAEPEAQLLGLARWEIPGRLEIRSRVGAGVIARAWRARALLRSEDGSRDAEIEVWVVPGSAVNLAGAEGLPPLSMEDFRK